MSRAGLTIVVPAWNEERRLAATVGEAVAAARRHLPDFELIVVDDGSTDGTAAVAARLAQRYDRLTVVRHPHNRGVGAAYQSGLALARFPYLTLIPGDHAYHICSLEALFARVGEVPLILGYRTNLQVRSPLRRLLSAGCTQCMRVVTGQPIRDAHGPFVFPVGPARQVRPNPGYGYHLEALATLLRAGLPYLEVPVRLNPRPDRSSRVLRPTVLARLAFALGRQFLRFVVLGRSVRHAG